MWRMSCNLVHCEAAPQNADVLEHMVMTRSPGSSEAQQVQGEFPGPQHPVGVVSHDSNLRVCGCPCGLGGTLLQKNPRGDGDP